jgi:hypothetical protein
MKKLLTSFLFLCFSLSFLNAKPVNEYSAKLAGFNFLRYKAASISIHGIDELQLIYKTTSTDDVTTYFYVFNFEHGFIIVSGDDVVLPILGYSGEKEFQTTRMAPNVSKWLESYKSQIRFAIVNKLDATPEIIQAWEELKSNEGAVNSSSQRASVDPLLHTIWDQPAPYNDLCPGGSVTGCVATAMAQVLKYWNYPAKGQGFHSFNHQNYGTLSANFGSTTYEWGSMPNSITNSNNAIATLMYHCGVSVEMEYSPEVSGAWVIENSPTPEANSEYAFKHYFGYDPSMQGIQRENYSDAQWNSKLKSELDAARPILYDGFGNGGGHCFVCDGYDNNDFFHFNWGWSGYYNGYFESDALNPGGTGTGGGTGGYNSGQEVIIGIKPPDGSGGGNASVLELYDELSTVSTYIYYGDGFDLTTNIINNGSGDFNGDYSAAVFDENLNFVDFMEIKSGWSLEPGYIYTDGLTFSTPGLLSMLPGTYYAAVFYRPTDGEWTIVGNGDFQNLLEIEVVNFNDIELYADMVVTPSTTLTQGKPASVTLNIINDGNFTFAGSYSIDLYDLSGNWIENIAEISEPNGLPPGYVYLDPFLKFSSISIDAEPGTYLLALTHTWNGDDWELSGSSYHQNPVFVTVQAAPLSPDQYENNNTSDNAYTLGLNYANNIALQKTTGSTCHNGTDYDFYKLNLPGGYDYSISARLHDNFNSGNGNTYTLDAQFSYSFDGVNWSEAYDDVLPGDILSENGGTIYFFVAPYFPGQTGTYLLDMQVTRSAITAISNIGADNTIKVFPNPASEMINIDWSTSAIHWTKASLVNLFGQEVFERKIAGENALQIPVGAFVPGLYLIKLESGQEYITRKIMITR